MTPEQAAALTFREFCERIHPGFLLACDRAGNADRALFGSAVPEPADYARQRRAPVKAATP